MIKSKQIKELEIEIQKNKNGKQNNLDSHLLEIVQKFDNKRLELKYTKKQ